MGKTIQFIQQSLGISEEDMPGKIAGLYPKASKIADAAAQFIDSIYKLLHDDKTMLSPQVVDSLIDARQVAQMIIRQSAVMSQLIRNPYHAGQAIEKLVNLDFKNKTDEDEDEVAEKAVA